MMPQARVLPGLNEWQVWGLQLLVFPTDPATALRQEWWNGLAMGPPEESRRKQFELVETGTYDGFNLTVSVDFQKIAWKVSAQLQADPFPYELPTIGDYPAVRDRFVDMMSPWLAERCPPVQRIGFAGALVLPTADHQAAYRQLDAYLATVQVDPNSTDFTYRVNRPVPSDSDIVHLTVNRIGTWSAVKVNAAIRVAVPGGAIQPPAAESKLYGCMLEFDVNTSAEWPGPLPTGRRVDLLRELARKATEMAQQGDNP